MPVCKGRRSETCDNNYKMTRIDKSAMKNDIRTIKKKIAAEVRGKTMKWRIRGKASAMAERLLEDIADETGELIGKLETDFLPEDEAVQSELTGYAYDLVDRALTDAIVRELEK